MIEASRFSAARPGLPGRFAIHGIDLVVEGDVRAAVEAVGMSYAAFATSDAVRAGAEHPVRIGAWHEGDRYRLIDHRGRPSIVHGETQAVLGLLDRVVETVLDHLATRGILGTHAGVVEVRERAILLSGRSGRGKSTLTLGLIRRGAGWLTDELALVAPDDHTMLPYPRALHVSPGTVDLLPELSFLHMRPRHELGGESEWSVTPADLEAAFGARRAGPTPLALIVLLDGDPDPAREPDIEADLAGPRRDGAVARHARVHPRLRGHDAALVRDRRAGPDGATAGRRARSDRAGGPRLVGRAAMTQLDALAIARRGLLEDYRTSGTTTWVTATGTSMEPLIPAGSRLLVEFGRRPVPGRRRDPVPPRRPGPRPSTRGPTIDSERSGPPRQG